MDDELTFMINTLNFHKLKQDKKREMIHWEENVRALISQ